MAGSNIIVRQTSGANDADAGFQALKQVNKLIADLEILRAATAGGYLSGSATYDPASLADGAGATTTVTVTGAALGDFALASFSLDLQGITLTAWVSATNTVSVRFQNESGGTLDLGSGTLRAFVRQQTATAGVAAATLTASKLTDHTGTVI
jgi:hypothetical protein